MTDQPETTDESDGRVPPIAIADEEETGPAAEAVEEVKQVKAAEKRVAGLTATQIGIGVGVGSAAVLAALLYTRKGGRKPVD